MSNSRRRGRRPLPETERKDRLIQARVDEDLDETLRNAARKKRVSVSQLVRNVLEDTFQLVDDVVAGTASLTEAVTHSAKRIAASAKGQTAAGRARANLDDVVAWQEVKIHQSVACAACGRYLLRGARSFMGLDAGGGKPRVWLCVDCNNRL